MVVRTQASLPVQKSMHTVSRPEPPRPCRSRSRRWMYFTGMVEACSSTPATADTPSVKATMPTPFSTTPVW